MAWGMSQVVRRGEHLHRVLPTDRAYRFNDHQGPKIIPGELTCQKHSKFAVSFRLKPSSLFSYSYVESNKESRWRMKDQGACRAKDGKNAPIALPGCPKHACKRPPTAIGADLILRQRKCFRGCTTRDDVGHIALWRRDYSKLLIKLRTLTSLDPRPIAHADLPWISTLSS